ncbi:hypothetical protein [Prosthecochloris sp. CIB 2401]|uniref:hypothetical protein n=1 Tax=Prosthecochloris sp. CIB 2401 TaxID=1868325 RepID=UPI0009F1D16A|nr:hypothetical protein [Prosthecochloris sp. CIB 2401]
MLQTIRTSHPRVYKHFSALEDGEKYVQQIIDIDAYWERVQGQSVEQVVVDGGSPAMMQDVDGEFDIICAGGTLGLLHASVMASVHGFRVLVFDRYAVGKATRDWNISREELDSLEKVGLFTSDQVDACIVSRYKTGWAEFSVSEDRRKRLYLDNVLDCALEADLLLGLALDKVTASPGCMVAHRMTFTRVHRYRDCVIVEVLDSEKVTRRYRARVFIDAMGITSPVAMQLNDGRPQTHVCPTVGTIASGLEGVDHEVGEILVSTEPADMSSGRGRQLIWEGFPAGRDRYITYLFFYDEIDSPNDKSLLGLFESYFEKLPGYKMPGRDFMVERPVFGIIPAYWHDGFSLSRRIADDRILMLGDAATLNSPLTFCGFGSFIRNISRLTGGLASVLREGRLDRSSLEQVSAYEPNVAAMANLMKYMCYDSTTDDPNFVNELMNEVMVVLDSLPPRYREAMFKDRMQLGELMAVGLNVAVRYPDVLRVTFEKLGFGGTIGMMKNLLGWAVSPVR